MNLTIHSRPLGGAITIPSSKSAAHRALILAALAKEPAEVRFSGLSEDLAATVGALTALGARLDRTEFGYRVTPIRAVPETAVLDCGESGSTLRFLLPVAAALGVGARFVCHGRLAARPLGDLRAALEEHGIRFSTDHEICGRLCAGEYSLKGNVSSQYVTGLLFALSLLDGESTVRLTTALESASYVRLTLSMLRACGADVTENPDGYVIRGVGRFSVAQTFAVEGDYSNAAFWLGAGISVSGLSLDSTQGDRAVLRLLAEMGAEKIVRSDAAVRFDTAALSPLDIDVTDIPDLTPPLAVLCATAHGTCRLYGARRLRLKESDRIATTGALLAALGVSVETEEDALIIHACGRLSGGTVDCANDHRIAMSGALASHFAKGDIRLIGAECVNKSYPRFWEDFASLGGHYTVTD